MEQIEISYMYIVNLIMNMQLTGLGGGGGPLGYLGGGGRIRSLSKLKNTPKALILAQKSTLILILKNADFFH